MSADAVLQLETVVTSVRDGDERLTVLDGADLRVEAGELVAVTGASGSGKSTLLAVAGLLRRPTSGSVTIAGHRADRLGRRARTRLRRDAVAVVHQAAQLFPALTAAEQLELIAHIRRDLDADARRRARDLLSGLGLAERADQLPGHLSGGERQRVGVARALMAEPSVLLADEPTSALDPARGREVMRLLADETRRRGLATVVVLHDPVHLEVADRCLRLCDGRLAPV